MPSLNPLAHNNGMLDTLWTDLLFWINTARLGLPNGQFHNFLTIFSGVNNVIARNEPRVAVSANGFTTAPLLSIVIAALYWSILTRAEAQSLSKDPDFLSVIVFE